MQNVSGPINVGDKLLWQPKGVFNIWAEFEVTGIKAKHREHDPLISFRVLKAFDRRLVGRTDLYDDENNLRQSCFRVL